jgi:ribosome maturation factor RimP
MQLNKIQCKYFLEMSSPGSKTFITTEVIHGEDTQYEYQRDR